MAQNSYPHQERLERSLKSLIKSNEQDGLLRDVSVNILSSDFYPHITQKLLDSANKALNSIGVEEDNITHFRTFGTFEMPALLSKLCEGMEGDVILVLGCVIQGETSSASSIEQHLISAITRIQVDYGEIIANGVIFAPNLALAEARSNSQYNKGLEAVVAAMSAYQTKMQIHDLSDIDSSDFL